jgi:hypothetical protein
VDEPVRIHHCVSTSTRASHNPVRGNIDYFYAVLNQGQSLSDLIGSILSNHQHRKALISNCSSSDAKALIGLLGPTQTLMVTFNTAPSISSISHKILIDPKGLLSRGINIPRLDLGISVGIHESKETILHQWARVGRESLSSVRAKFFMVLPNSDELDQLRYLEFQLGVRFHEYNPTDLCRIAPTHPFHLHSTTEERLRAVAALIAS